MKQIATPGRRVRTSMVAAVVVVATTSVATAGKTDFSVPGDYPSIQAAIDEVPDGATITVAPGTYFEAIEFNGRPITVQSADGADSTIIDATGLMDAVVTFDQGETSTSRLVGFTLTGGDGASFGGQRLGGGIYIAGATPSVELCVIEGNSADVGGGISISSTVFSAQLRGCVIANNFATFGSGIAIRSFGSARAVHATIFGNDGGTAIDLQTGTALALSNSIVWGHEGGSVNVQFAAQYSNVEGGAFGIGVIDENPFFVNAATGDLRLSSLSPCIDAADSSASLSDVPTDTAGETRLVDDPARPDTGIPAFGLVVDMGAYERQVGVTPGGCTGDITGDDLVGFLDLVELIAAWGPCP